MRKFKISNHTLKSMKFITKDSIELNKELSDLDIFTLDFIKILRKYTEYVVISGYASILLGRSRSSEDVDIIIPKLNPETVNQLWNDLQRNKFYCLQTDSAEEMYNYLKDKFAIRFAKKNTVIPNIELKFVKNKIDEVTLQKKISVKINNEEIIISELELQIAFKENVLKSPKDIEDALHLRAVAAEHLNLPLITTYKRMLDDFY